MGAVPEGSGRTPEFHRTHSARHAGRRRRHLAAVARTAGRDTSRGPGPQPRRIHPPPPAMRAAGAAPWRLGLERQGAIPAVVTGHSLGEFTALVAAGAIDFTTCVDLVRFRGQVMQEAVPAGSGAMAALLGLEDAD